MALGSLSVVTIQCLCSLSKKVRLTLKFKREKCYHIDHLQFEPSVSSPYFVLVSSCNDIKLSRQFAMLVRQYEW